MCDKNIKKKKRRGSKETLSQLLDYLIKDDRLSAYMLTQKTWRHNNDFAQFESLIPHKLLSYEIVDAYFISLNSKDYDVKMKYMNVITKNIKETNIKARLIREASPYTPCINGEWGVNPISMIKQVEEGK